MLKPSLDTVAQDPAPLAPSDAEADADSPASLLPLDSPSSSVRSRPIAIELPVPKKITSNHSVSVYTPPAPLSARGDLPGGYFPLHEDQNRVYRGHPFQPDASQARKRSIQLASETIPLETHSLQPAPAPPAPAVEPQPATQYFPVAAPGPALSSPAPTTDGMSPSRSTTPVASYIPSGVHANPLPMGKYYPSNYEKRREEKLQQQVIRPSPSGNLATSVKSDSQVPTFRSDSSMGHSRNESEAKRRLQQYQRDMIAQATLALNGGNVNAAALNAISLRNMGFTSLNTKPSKPRLVPLGSPGPVTPMELESSDDGYLGARVPASEDSTQIEEIARAIRIEEERRRREGTTSPAIELGPAC